MKHLNKIMLIGRLGNNPVQRETKNGLAVVHFSLATSRRVTEAGAEAEGAGSEKSEKAEKSEKEETTWHRIVVWGRQAEACKLYITKGHLVYVEGSMRTRKYSAKDGAQRMAFEVHAENVSFLAPSKRLVSESLEVAGVEGVPVESLTAEADAVLREAAAAVA
jgi:single-strand DNA-binding protein